MMILGHRYRQYMVAEMGTVVAVVATVMVSATEKLTHVAVTAKAMVRTTTVEAVKEAVVGAAEEEEGRN